MAQPGLPRVKLWPEAASAFLPETWSEPLAPGTEKRIYPLHPPQWTGDPRPLKAFYVLRTAASKSASKRVTIRDVPKSRAFLDITGNTFNSWLADTKRLRGQFGFASDLSARIPVRSLSYPRGYEHLPRVVERLRHDAERDR
jgi:hypothetical protein